jgi:hypothetical protein
VGCFVWVELRSWRRHRRSTMRMVMTMRLVEQTEAKVNDGDLPPSDYGVSSIVELIQPAH